MMSNPRRGVILEPIISRIIKADVVPHHFTLQPLIAVDLFYNLFKLKEFFAINHGIILSVMCKRIVTTLVFFVK